MTCGRRRKVNGDFRAWIGRWTHQRRMQRSTEVTRLESSGPSAILQRDVRPGQPMLRCRTIALARTDGARRPIGFEFTPPMCMFVRSLVIDSNPPRLSRSLRLTIVLVHASFSHMPRALDLKPNIDEVPEADECLDRHGMHVASAEWTALRATGALTDEPDLDLEFEAVKKSRRARDAPRNV